MLVSFNGGDLYANPACVEAISVEFITEHNEVARYVKIQVSGEMHRFKICEPANPCSVASDFAIKINDALKLKAALRAA